MSELHPPNVWPSLAPPGAVVDGWKKLSSRRRRELEAADPAHVFSVICDVFVGARLVARSEGYVTTMNGYFEFEGEEYSFCLPRCYLLSSSTSQTDSEAPMMVSLHHPTEIIHLRFKTLPANRSISPLATLDAFLNRPPEPQLGGKYPPLSPKPNDPGLRWGERLKIAAVVGLGSTAIIDPHNTALYWPLYGAALVGHAIWMPMLFGKEERGENQLIPLPTQAERERSKMDIAPEAIANLIAKKDSLLPELPEHPADKKDPAWIPPSREGSDVFPISFYYLDDQFMSAAALAAHRFPLGTSPNRWAAYCRVVSANRNTPILEDVGTVSIEDGCLSFRGINTAFRIGGQFVEDTQSYPADAKCSCWIPLVHPGHRVWIGFEEVRRSEASESLYDAVQEFKRANEASPYLTVYPSTEVTERAEGHSKAPVIISSTLLVLAGVLIGFWFYHLAIAACVLSVLADFLPRRTGEVKRWPWRTVKPAVRAPTLPKNVFERG